MNNGKNKQDPPEQDIQPGHPDYKPGNTGLQKDLPKVEKKDSPEKTNEPADKQEKEGEKVVNEQEQNKVINDDEKKVGEE